MTSETANAWHHSETENFVSRHVQGLTAQQAGDMLRALQTYMNLIYFSRDSGVGYKIRDAAPADALSGKSIVRPHFFGIIGEKVAELAYMDGNEPHAELRLYAKALGKHYKSIRQEADRLITHFDA